ncbi:prepilin-type N-terminal cleavage/methylation domain-containing protein [Candidatus Saccharibacteria bacterium]|nr:prepilin-type N-terminal cleavage/methylation domain-containing protein [Candidatus Saccharibacteria bacterium]
MFGIKTKKKSHGFSVIELLTVIVIIGVLATVAFLSYSGWNQSVAVTQIKSDLTAIVASMETSRNFNNSYPSTIPPTFKASDGIIVSGGSSDGLAYCMEAYSIKYPGQVYAVSSVNKDPYLGTCDPSVSVFTVGSVIDLTVPITYFTAVDNVGVTGYMITESSSSPLAGGSGWVVSAPSSYTTSSAGTKNLYPWVKDANGNVSDVFGSPRSVVFVTPDPNWNNGRPGSVLAGKQVYNRDLTSTDKYSDNSLIGGTGKLRWKTSQTSCAEPQCSATAPVAETHPGHVGQSVLVADNSTDFALSGSPPVYPARDACKALGGRLPTLAEMVEMGNQRSWYGNLKPHTDYTNYWTATVAGANFTAYAPFLNNGSVDIYNALFSYSGYVRCVR